VHDMRHKTALLTYVLSLPVIYPDGVFFDQPGFILSQFLKTPALMRTDGATGSMVGIVFHIFFPDVSQKYKLNHNLL